MSFFFFFPSLQVCCSLESWTQKSHPRKWMASKIKLKKRTFDNWLPYILFNSEEVCYDQKKIGLLASRFPLLTSTFPLLAVAFRLFSSTLTVTDIASDLHRIPIYATKHLFPAKLFNFVKLTLSQLQNYANNF